MFERQAVVDKNEVIVDEKRRLAVNARNLTYFQNQLYARNYFKSFRPDLNSMDQYVYFQKLKLGEMFLNEATKAFHREEQRTYLMTPSSEASKKLQVFFYFILKKGIFLHFINFLAIFFLHFSSNYPFLSLKISFAKKTAKENIF